MEKKRVFLLERDHVEAGAVASLLELAGHEVAGVAHSLDDAVKVNVGTDATPAAELLSAAGIPYAFIIQPGDLIDPALFPGAGFLRKPLNTMGIEAVLKSSNGATSQPAGPSPRGGEARTSQLKAATKRLG